MLKRAPPSGESSKSTPPTGSFAQHPHEREPDPVSSPIATPLTALSENQRIGENGTGKGSDAERG